MPRSRTRPDRLTGTAAFAYLCVTIVTVSCATVLALVALPAALHLLRPLLDAL